MFRVFLFFTFSEAHPSLTLIPFYPTYPINMAKNNVLNELQIIQNAATYELIKTTYEEEHIQQTFFFRTDLKTMFKLFSGLAPQ